MFRRLRFQLPPDFREAVKHEPEVFAGDADHLHMVESRACGDARRARQESHFAEIRTPGQVGQDHIPARTMLGYFHEPESYQVKAIGHLTLCADDLSRLKAQQLDMLPQMVDEVLSQRRQHWNAAQVRIQRALLIGTVQLFAEILVPLHDVENIAQHLEHCAIGLRTHCRRARVVTHASHLAKPSCVLSALGMPVPMSRNWRIPASAARKRTPRARNARLARTEETRSG